VIYINTIIDADYVLEIHHLILAKCSEFSDMASRSLSGVIGGVQLYLPTSPHAKSARAFFEMNIEWEKNNPDALTSDFVEENIDCFFRYVTFDIFSKEYLTSHGGPGIIRIPIRGFFQPITYILGTFTSYRVNELTPLEVDLLREQSE
jgi:hypothetical protein